MGDKLVQESIFCSWIGIFSLLNKRNYVAIALNTIEQEYGQISFKDLEQLRLNSYIKFNGSNHDKDGRQFYCVALDECQEILNSWTKKLPMGTNETKWVEHSKNLMFARQCIINFENREYRRGHIESIDVVNETLSFKTGTSNNHIRTVIPRNTNEKILIYKFIVNLLHGDEASDSFTSERCDDLIQNLRPKDAVANIISINSTIGNKEPDSLEDCINQLFDYTIDGINIAEEDPTNDVDNDNGTNNINNESNNIRCHKLALVPIFDEAVKELQSKNIIESRHRRKKRMSRNHQFFLDINDKVSNYVLEMNESVSKLNIGDDLQSPSFCLTYNNI